MIGLTEAASHHDCQVLVIGSGAGGATTAALLAEAGLDVLVVEEGPWVEQGCVVPFSLEQMDRQYRAGGVTVALGLPSIAYTEGRCAGGGTEVNSGLYRRPPAETLDRWRAQTAIADFTDDEFDAACDEVEVALSVQTVPGRHTPASERLRAGAAALGWQHDEIPRWMSYPDGGDAAGGRRESMTATYLPRALAAGARILVEHRVDRLDPRRRPGVPRRAHRARTVRPGDDRLRDGRRVRRRDPDAGAAAAFRPPGAGRQGPRRPPDGEAGRSLRRGGQRRRRRAGAPGEGVRPRPLVRRLGEPARPGRAGAHRQLAARCATPSPSWRDIAVYYAAITSEGRGWVTALPGLRDPLVTYRLTARDRALLGQGLGRLALVMLEAGALEVYPSFRDAPIVRDAGRPRRDAPARSAATASVMTVHLCSTVPMGEDRSRRRPTASAGCTAPTTCT